MRVVKTFALYDRRLLEGVRNGSLFFKGLAAPWESVHAPVTIWTPQLDLVLVCLFCGGGHECGRTGKDERLGCLMWNSQIISKNIMLNIYFH